MKIRYFYNIAVYWRWPLKGNKGPTQCVKCSMFGHGAQNCNRVEVCPACAGNHDYAVCTLNKFSLDGSVIYKCYNCVKKNFRNVNHRADDPRCPYRQEYLDIRRRISSRSRVVRSRDNCTNFDKYVINFPQTLNQVQMDRTHAASSSNKKLFSEVSKQTSENTK